MVKLRDLLEGLPVLDELGRERVGPQLRLPLGDPFEFQFGLTLCNLGILERCLPLELSLEWTLCLGLLRIEVERLEHATHVTTELVHLDLSLHISI